MEQKLKSLNHDVRNLIPIKETDLDSLKNVNNKEQLILLIRSLNEALVYFTEEFVLKI
jgi:hypothetical protein